MNTHFFKKLLCLGMIFSLTFIGLSGCGQKKTELVNVSFDATREFYKEYNRLFEDYWYGRTGEKVEVIQSHGGSGKQALEVANGLEADVVTLALEYDEDAIQDAGLFDDGWISEFDNARQSIISYRKLPQTDRELRRMCQLKNPLNHMTVMFSKKEVLDAGGYQHFYLFEDYYLWARMLLLGVEARNLPDTLLYMRAGTGMYKRRGGWKYVKSMLHFRLFLWKSGLSSFWDFVVCAGGQMMICLIPNRLRELFYKKFLRK